MTDIWTDSQDFEKDWWGTCQNTMGEEYKQTRYFALMGLKFFHDCKSPYNIDMQGKRVLDIGGGPVSMLLKCKNVSGVVVDPCNYPKWIDDRYAMANIKYIRCGGETIPLDEVFDEVWIYNVLQHTESVEKVIENARRLSKIIRLFEWVDTGTTRGHHHNLTKEWLDRLLEGDGKTEFLNEPQLWGKCYYGVFKGRHYV